MKQGRGFDIRIQRAGSDWMAEKRFAIGIDGKLPQAWEQVKAEADVVRAVIYPSTQRCRRANKRKIADKFEREVQA